MAKAKQRIKITEESKIQEEWYKEATAKGMTMESLPDFLKKLLNDYEHDYGTVCHALAAGAVATATAMNRDPGARGGITGFQSGAVMWEFIRWWRDLGKFKPLKLVDYDNMLFPQYQDHFEKTITKDTWEHLQKQAKEHLAGDLSMVHENVKAHWESIVAGVVPFGYTVEKE